MENKQVLQNLDLILDALRENESLLLESFCRDNLKPTPNEFIITEYISELKDKGYIKNTNGKFYSLTIKGIAFKGYYQTHLDTLYERLNNRRNDKLLRSYTLFAAIGTCGFLLFEVLKYLINNLCFC